MLNYYSWWVVGGWEKNEINAILNSSWSWSLSCAELSLAIKAVLSSTWLALNWNWAWQNENLLYTWIVNSILSLYWDSSIITWTSAWGLMDMVAVMVKLLAVTTKLLLLYLKFCLLNQGWDSKYIVLKRSENMVENPLFLPELIRVLMSGETNS